MTGILKLALILVMGCMAVSCVTKREQQAANARWGAAGVNYTLLDLRYIQDRDTGLCFAYGARGHGSILAHVPCTEAVMEQIKR